MSLLASLVAEPTPQLRSIQRGRVISVVGGVVKAALPSAAIGDRCIIECRGAREISAQVIAFNEDVVTLAPMDEAAGISPGVPVIGSGQPFTVAVSEALIGAVVDSLGAILSPGVCNSAPTRSILLEQSPPPPLSRTAITELFPTGVRAIDALCSLGIGQRIGVFAEAGVGKSTLLGLIARRAEVDLAVIALVGERGREVKEFLDHILGNEGRRRCIVVVATSDESPARRALAADTATAIASFFRASGKRVLLCIDSLTRVARALREIGLAAGELPIRQGMTPSVYTKLPKLLEQAGTDAYGSVTAIYTVLTNGAGEVDPLGEEVKSILDGHLVLSQRTVEEGVRPAIDLTSSISRLMSRLHDEHYCNAARSVINIVALLRREKELLLFGGTPTPELEAALELEQEIISFRSQSECVEADRQQSEEAMRSLATRYTNRVAEIRRSRQSA